jgi:hypothetical protein
MEKFLKILFSLTLSWLLSTPSFTQATRQDTIPNLKIFNQLEGKYLYRATIEYKNDTLTGLLIIKKDADSSFRIAMVTEVGISLFEMEFYTNSKAPFKLHSCVPYLNKKLIINTLRRDFESLFINFAVWEPAKVRWIDDEYRFKFRREGTRCYFTNRYGEVHKIRHQRNGFTKEIINLETSKNPYPMSVSMKHQSIKLNINLLFLK